jgi:hypothetical protein
MGTKVISYQSVPLSLSPHIYIYIYPLLTKYHYVDRIKKNDVGVARAMLGGGGRHADGYWWLNLKKILIGINSLRWGGGGSVNVDFK